MGGGAILQLVGNTNNIPDIYLTGNPTITHFKVLYRRTTQFSTTDIKMQLNAQFGDTVLKKIDNQGDMLHKLSLVLDIPTPDVVYREPTYRVVRTLLKPYNLDYVIDEIVRNDSNIDLDNTVTYEDLFGTIETEFDGPLSIAFTNRSTQVNDRYSQKLDIVKNIQNTYAKSRVDHQNIVSKYIAFKPELVDYTQFAIDDEIVDPSGYLVMTSGRTQDFYDQFVATPTISFSFDCNDFIFDPRTYAEHLNGDGIDQTPDSVIRDLIRAYPRQLTEVSTGDANYTNITSTADFNAIMSDATRNHNIIIPISLINRCRRVLLERIRIENRLGPNDFEDLDTLNMIENDECIFGELLIEDLIDDQFSFGIYSFDPTFVDTDIELEARSIITYDTCIANLFRRARISVPTLAFDKEVITVINPNFNRYSINDDAIYDRGYDITYPLKTIDTDVDLNGDTYVTDPNGYWLVDLTLVDRIGIQDEVIGESTVLPDTNILVNPLYIHRRSDRLEFAPYNLNKLTDDTSVVLKNIIVDPITGEVADTGNTVIEKQTNMIDGLDFVSDAVLESYPLLDVSKNVNGVIGMLDNTLFTIQDYENYHRFLVAMYNDMLNTENQANTYRLDSTNGINGSNLQQESPASNRQTLFNAIDIQGIMTGKLLRDVIYVDQYRYGKDYDISFNYFNRLDQLEDFVSVAKVYDVNTFYSISSLVDLDDRELAHRLSKYLMWSYRLENFEVQQVTTSSNVLDESAFVDSLKSLNKLMISNAINPNSSATLEYLKNIHYMKADIDSLFDTYVYEDDSIIERYETEVPIQPEKNWFERDHVLSGIRYNADDTINNQIEDLRDLVGNGLFNPLFVDGRGTAMNREVEMYHTLCTIDHLNRTSLRASTDRTVPEYFREVITESYTVSRATTRNYEHTIAYQTVLKYLDEFYADRLIINENTDELESLTSVLGELVSNTIIKTYSNYNRYVWYMWKNSSFVDREILPRIYSDIIISTTPDVRIRTSTDYCDTHHDTYLTNEYPDILVECPELTTIGPDALKINFYAGIDNDFRPRMGYAVSSGLDLNIEESYRTEKSIIIEEREFTSDEAVVPVLESQIITEIQTEPIIGRSQFRDCFSTHIDERVQYVKNEMQNLLNIGNRIDFNVSSAIVQNQNRFRTKLAYVDWFDLQNYTDRSIAKIATDRSLTDLTYYDNTYVLNHLPSTMVYYYGLYAQKMYGSIYPVIDIGLTPDYDSIDDENTYVQLESADIITLDNTITPLTDSTTPPTGIVDSVMQFISTDVRESAECPIHGDISTLTQAQRDIFDDFLYNNEGVTTVATIYDECPLCFRTYAFNQLFEQVNQSVMFSATESQCDTTASTAITSNTIVDDDYIELIKNGPIDLEGNVGLNKIMYLYRPEPVIYDRVTETYYDTVIEFVLVRIATIYYRYARMILHLLQLSAVDYNTIVTGWTPTLAQTIFGQLDTVTYGQYVTYLDDMRTNSSASQFEEEIDRLNISILQDSSSTLRDTLKNSIRTLAPIPYNEYTESESVIRTYSVGDVIENIEYDSTSLSTLPYKGRVHQMYRGQIALWYEIQNNIIRLYNEYFNDLTIPNQIESNIGITPDLFIEVYNTLIDVIPTEYIADGKVDYYRLKQNYEYLVADHYLNPLVENLTVNDVDVASVDMMNYSRDLMIYFKTLLSRYEKRKFIVETIKNTIIDQDANYFDMSNIIAKNLIDPIKDRIESFEQNEVVLTNVDDRECFFFNDTSNMYYTDAITFRTDPSRESIASAVEDFISFDHMNNYHLSQVFTFDQHRELLRLLGLVELDEQNITNFTSSLAGPSVRVDDLFRDIALGYTDDFDRYRCLNSASNLDNSSIYTKQELVYALGDEYLYDINAQLVANKGLFYDISVNYPTISDILYNIDYDPISFKVDDRGNFVKKFTGHTASSPLNILKNRLEFHDEFGTSTDYNGRYFHTPELREWEERMVGLYGTGIDQFNAVRRVYNVYRFLNGSYDYNDSYSTIETIIANFTTYEETVEVNGTIDRVIGSCSIQRFIELVNGIKDDIVTEISKSFGLPSAFQTQSILTTLVLLNNRYTNRIDDIKLVYRQCIDEQILLLNRIADTFEFYTRSLSDAEVTTIMDSIYDTIELLDTELQKLDNIISVLLETIRVNVISGVIMDEASLNLIVDGIIVPYVTLIETYYNTIVSELTRITNESCMDFRFIRNLDEDCRTRTPFLLFNSKELGFMNNFRTVEDSVRYLIASLLAYVVPTLLETTEYYLDGVITECEQQALDAQKILDDATGTYGKRLPSVFDGVYDRKLVDANSIPNPFRVGNSFRTTLCTDLKSLYTNRGVIDLTSDSLTCTNYINGIYSCIERQNNILTNIVNVERYIDLTITPGTSLSGTVYNYYDLTRFVLFDGGDELVCCRGLTYDDYKKRTLRKINSIADRSNTKSAIIRKGTSRDNDSNSTDGLVDSRKRVYKQKRLVDRNGSLDIRTKDAIKYVRGLKSRNTTTTSVIGENGIDTPTFIGSDVHDSIANLIDNRSCDSIPKHAWVRQLGLRAIEELTILIDGEEIYTTDSEQLLMNREMFIDPEHDRGFDTMVGHIPEMYSINNERKPSMRLYVNTFFTFSRYIGASIPLVGMLYSTLKVKVKLRNINKLLYIEPGARLNKPIKIKTHLLGRFIYLDTEERKRIASTRTNTLIERVRGVTNIITSSDIIDSNTLGDGLQSNIVRQRYYFEDPTRYIMWRARLIYPIKKPEDIIYWDMSGGSVEENNRLGIVDNRNNSINSIQLFDRIKIQMNSVNREDWRENNYYRFMVPYNRNIRDLDTNEGIYSMCLYPKILQPSGSTNLSFIDDLSFYYQLSDHAVQALAQGAKIRLQTYQNSNNIFMAVSGFGALMFYSAS
jgi:ssDNA-specific exonuclease RecJ